MRIVAGILLIILGVPSILATGAVADVIAWARAMEIGATSYEHFREEFTAIRLHDLAALNVFGLFLIGWISGGGICALLKKAWFWVLSGAIGAVLVGITLTVFMPLSDYLAKSAPIDFVLKSFLFGVSYSLMGLVALVFLVRRREEFSP